MDEWRMVFDMVLPGTRDGWPCASAALGATGLAAVHQACTHDQRARIHGWANEIGALTSEERHARLAAIYRKEAGAFETMLGTLYAHYYSTPSVREHIARLAEEGPTETEHGVDTTLTEAVVRHQRGNLRQI